MDLSKNPKPITGNVDNILVVVDVQNCFIQGGSLNDKDNKMPLTIQAYINQAKIISNLVMSGKYKKVIFTRDYHPEYHSSLFTSTNPVVGVYEAHCRNKNRTCNPQPYNYDGKYKELVSDYNKDTVETVINKKSTPNEFIIDPAYKKLKVNGTDLSYLFYGTSIAPYIQKLNIGENHNIGLKNDDTTDRKNWKIINPGNIKGDPKFDNLNIATGINSNNLYYSDGFKLVPVPIDKLKNTTCITLTKGEYCNYESYSAFNYHIKINTNTETKNPADNTLQNLEPSKDNSTGLFEYILYDDLLNKLGVDNIGKKTINIDVCGLVTNICVINTVQQGIAMWKKVYQNEHKNITVNFALLEYASLPLPIQAPGNMNKNYNYTTPVNNNVTQLNELVNLYKAKFNSDLHQETTFDFPPTFDLYFAECQKVKIELSRALLTSDKLAKFTAPIDTTCKCDCTNQPPGKKCRKCNLDYKMKYLKYKQKYLELKNQL